MTDQPIKIPMFDEIVHTPDHPCCGDRTCPCRVARIGEILCELRKKLSLRKRARLLHEALDLCDPEGIAWQMFKQKLEEVQQKELRRKNATRKNKEGEPQ